MKSVFLIALALSSGIAAAQTPGSTAREMEAMGYVNVQDVAPDIHVSLMYARPDNFTGQVLYADLREAYLHPKAARALARAQELLKADHPNLNLKVYDAARPMHIQQRMWNVVAGTSKARYVSNPKNGGGLHNYGMAVDLTLCDERGDTLPMGTVIDYLGVYAHITNEEEMVKRGVLTREAHHNRKLLRNVMKQAGFRPLSTEWWHFNFISRAEAKAHYKPIP